MNSPRQRIMQHIGRSGCYLLCYVYLGEQVLGKRIDAVEIYERSTDPIWWRSDGTRGPLMTEECWVVEASALMELVCGGTWQVRHGTAEEMCGDQEFEILRYERVTPEGRLGHFVVGNGFGVVAYDPLGDSQTVLHGELVSKRIVKNIGG